MHFARYYDALMDDPLSNAERVRGYLQRHRPGARSLLELGCGSGSVLARLRDVPSLTGVDRSPQMLAIARAKVPRARLVAADIATFDLHERFDAVICVFDTLNHLVRFEDWRALFERVAAHLYDDGLFAFDVNTLGQLRRLASGEPWVRELAAATISQRVEWLGAGQALWHVVIGERAADGATTVHHERIGELGVALARIEDALAGDFVALERADDDGRAPTDASARAYFAYRRRARAAQVSREIQYEPQPAP